MPEDLGTSHIRVNIAGYELRRVRNGQLEELMRVVVGKPYHQTPVFSDEIEYLEFNPYWNVPYSIAVNEELPKLKTNPAARAARGFEAVVDGRGVSLTSINWSTMSRPSRFRSRSRKLVPHRLLENFAKAYQFQSAGSSSSGRFSSMASRIAASAPPPRGNSP